jgi:hypothetical protein
VRRLRAGRSLPIRAEKPAKQRLTRTNCLHPQLPLI